MEKFSTIPDAPADTAGDDSLESLRTLVRFLQAQEREYKAEIKRLEKQVDNYRRLAQTAATLMGQGSHNG